MYSVDYSSGSLNNRNRANFGYYNIWSIGRTGAQTNNPTLRAAYENSSSLIHYTEIFTANHKHTVLF